MIYAKQTNPAYQESPLMVFDEWPDNMIVTGNRDYNSHTIPEYDHIMDYFNDMANEWENDGCYYINTGLWHYKKHAKKHEYTLAEILRDYGFERGDGKPWTTRQRHEWRLLMEREEGADDEEILLSALALMTGKAWKSGTIHRCCQGDWQDIIYSADDWSKEAIEHFEAEYFNTGSEWMIHDEEKAPDDPDDITGYIVYCYGWNDDAIRKEIADYTGEQPENVVMYAWDGYDYSANYREVC